MSLWFRRSEGLNTETMRDIASNADVSWSAESIMYRGDGIGYADGQETDATAIQDAAENLLGFRPVKIEEPSKPDETTKT